MTWTYTNDPASVPRDEVRFLIGDTDSTDPLVTDEEIAYAITAEGSAKMAAAQVADAISAKFARKADKSVGDLSISYSQQSKNYADLAKRLRTDASISGAMVYAGGISRADKSNDETDSDRVKPSFERGLMDNPGGSTNESTDT